MNQFPLYSSEVVKEILKTRISAQFNRIKEAKCTYIHPEILTTINFIYDWKFTDTALTGKIYEFVDDPNAYDADPAPNLFIFVYAKYQTIKTIAQMVIYNSMNNFTKNYFVYFCPSIDYLCQQQIKKSGIWQKVSIRKFDFGFLPFNENLYSLELPRNLNSVEKQSVLTDAMLRLYFTMGAFKNVLGKGAKAKSLLEQLERKKKQIAEIGQRQQDNNLLIVLDRDIDLVTPLLTGLSYQSLLDYFFGIDKNRITIPSQILSTESSQSHSNKKKQQAFLLNNKKDTVYKEISSMNINEVSDYLTSKSKQLRSRIEKQKEKADNYEDLDRLNKTLMVEYLLIQNHQSLVLELLKRMKSIQFNNSLVMESSILQGQNAQTPFKYDDVEYLSLFYNFEHLLKLICLHSQCTDSSKYYTKNQKNIIEFLLNLQRVDQIPSIHSLKKAELLKDTIYKNNWKQICDKFGLLPSQDAYDPYTELNIIYSAFSVKIVELIMKNKLDPEKSSLVSNNTYYSGVIPKLKKLDQVFVIFIGGVTYNELSCIKLLQKKLDKKITVLTTEILGKDQLIKKHMQNITESALFANLYSQSQIQTDPGALTRSHPIQAKNTLQI